VSCVAGAVTELWHDNAAYTVGREYLVTIDAIGDAIVGYVDGVELFSVRDGSHSSGTVGLYCWADTGARFSSIRVVPAAWSTYYRFDLDEELLAAGTRVLVHSGNAADWTQPSTPGVAHRFVATGQDHGQRRLPTSRAVDLRWRDLSGKVGHARRFLPAAEYRAVATARVLRKADGTEFAIFVPSGGPLGATLTPGQYRLGLTFRRNNTAVDPNSIVLTRAGDASDEAVAIDVPWIERS
jgi:hypothetical protein